MNFVPVKSRRRWRWKTARLARRVSRWALALLWPAGTAVTVAVWWSGHPDPVWWWAVVVLLLFAAILGAALIGRGSDDRHR